MEYNHGKVRGLTETSQDLADSVPACQSRDRPQCPPLCCHSIWVSSSAHTWKPEKLGQEGRRPLHGQIHPSGTFCALTTDTRSAATEWSVPWPPVSLKTWEGPQENRLFQAVQAGSSEPGCVIWIRAGRGDSSHSSEGGRPGPPRIGPRAMHLQLSPRVAPQRTSNQSQCRVTPAHAPSSCQAQAPGPQGKGVRSCPCWHVNRGALSKGEPLGSCRVKASPPPHCH